MSGITALLKRILSYPVSVFRPKKVNLDEEFGQFIAYLQMPEADVVWSHFDSPEEAIAEIRRLQARLAADDPDVRHDIGMLIAPTGAMQEISISSGWGQEFLQLAGRIDAKLGKY